MAGQFIIGLVGYALVVNLLGYAAMAVDKARAESNLRRVSEATLLNLAFIGGSIGVSVAQRTRRHKTRKEPFRSRLIGIMLLQLLALAALVVGLAVAGSPKELWHALFA